MAVRGLRWFVSTSKPYYIKGLLSVCLSVHAYMYMLKFERRVTWRDGRTASPLCSRTSCLTFLSISNIFFWVENFFFEKKYFFFFFRKKKFFSKNFFWSKKIFFRTFFSNFVFSNFFFSNFFRAVLATFFQLFFNFFFNLFFNFFFQTFLFQTFLSTFLVFTTEHKVCDIVIFLCNIFDIRQKNNKISYSLCPKQ